MANTESKKKKPKNDAAEAWFKGEPVPADAPGCGAYKTKAGPVIYN